MLLQRLFFCVGCEDEKTCCNFLNILTMFFLRFSLHCFIYLFFTFLVVVVCTEFSIARSAADDTQRHLALQEAQTSISWLIMEQTWYKFWFYEWSEKNQRSTNQKCTMKYVVMCTLEWCLLPKIKISFLPSFGSNI